MFGFERIAEAKILEAQKKGTFDNLEGEGKPLDLSDMNMPEEIRMGYKILKNAGFVPPEIEMQKEIQSLEKIIDTINNEDEKSKAVAKLNKLIMKFNIVSNRKFHNEIPQYYYEKITTKLER